MIAKSHCLRAALVLFAALPFSTLRGADNSRPTASFPFPAPASPDTGGSELALGAVDSHQATFLLAASDSTGPQSPEADNRLAKADSHYNAGRQLYFQGDLDGARKEFDAAVDVLLTAPDNLPDHRRIERRLDEICDMIYRFDVEKLGAGQNEEDAVVFDKAPIDEISHMTFPVDENLAPKVKAELNQTASGIPLELSDPVLSYIHYFSTDKGRKILLAGFERAGRYKPMIERIFTQEGVPQELVYLAQAESGFLPRAVSYKSAGGMWQFMPAAAVDYNLTRNSTLDQRFDPEQATRAAAKYLKDLHARYSDWYLAMAAYNCGPAVVDRAVERTGYADYWELLKRHALPNQTANYVPIILAMTIMAKNPGDYGLENVVTDQPIQYDTIHLSVSTNLNLVADAAMQPASVIRDLNPALLGTIAPAGYEVHTPKGSGESARAALESVPEANRQAWRLHHVESGDTLATIAKTYHLAPDRIVAVNRGVDSLEAGDVLLIPAVYHEETKSTRSRSRLTHAKQAASTSKSGSHRSTAIRNSSHVSASRHVSSQVLHRKAAVRTASLH